MHELNNKRLSLGGVLIYETRTGLGLSRPIGYLAANEPFLLLEQQVVSDLNGTTQTIVKLLSSRHIGWIMFDSRLRELQKVLE